VAPLEYALFNAEWQNFRQKLVELRQITTDAKNSVQKELGGGPVMTVRGDGKIGVPEKTLLACFASIDPPRLLDVVRSMYSGLLVAMCCAIDQNAAKLGLGIQLGDRISTFLWSIISKISSKFQVEGDDGQAREADQLTWGKLGVKAACTSVSLWLSWRLKDFCAAWAACHWGGVKIAEATLRLLRHDDDALKEVLGLILASYGFAYQLRHLNRPPVPWVMSFLLTPAFILEAGLRGLAIGGGK